MLTIVSVVSAAQGQGANAVLYQATAVGGFPSEFGDCRDGVLFTVSS